MMKKVVYHIVRRSYHNLSPVEARALIRSGVTAIDVREPHELQETSIKGAINLPLSVLNETGDVYETFMSKVPNSDASSKIVVFCKAGGRSAQACDIFEKNSFSDVRNMVGGITQWNNEGLSEDL